MLRNGVTLEIMFFTNFRILDVLDNYFPVESSIRIRMYGLGVSELLYYDFQPNLTRFTIV